MKEEDENLIIAVTVGYMLKVCKNNKPIPSKLRNEFNCIKHGNYNDFLDLIGGEIPLSVIANIGQAPTVLGVNKRSEDLDYLKGQCDFVKLHSSGPSLKKFYLMCINQYGKFNDSTFQNVDFAKFAAFEIRIRMHATNKNLISSNDKLIDIIEKLCNHIEMDNQEIEIIHSGRKFINKIKHNENPNYDWISNHQDFLKAYSILDKYRIKIL